MKVNSHNEWDTLKEIIVGNPKARASLIFDKQPTEKLKEEAEELARQAYPKNIVEEIGEDLNELTDVIKDFGAKVYRPNDEDIHKIYSTPNVIASSEHAYNARDLHLVVGNSIIESPSQEKHRYFEAQAYYDVFYKYFEQGCKWISGPKPRLKGDYMIPYYEDEKSLFALTEDEILFEAANTVRMGKDLLYLVSRSGNEMGAKWLQSVLGDEYRVHTTNNIYKSSHIDSTAMCLKPKVVLLNATRVNEHNCPPVFKNWKKIWFKDIVTYPHRVTEFNRNVRIPTYAKLLKLGVKSTINGISSEWIGLNFLSLDKKTVVVDKIQTKLIKVLEKNGFNCIPISFRWSYIMGGIHCSTLDMVRDSKLESYCD